MSKKSNILAICIALVALIWIGSGFLKNDHSKSVSSASVTESELEDGQELFQVRVADLIAQDYQQRVSITGLTQAFLDVTVRAEVAGAVRATPIDEGRFVMKDTVIFELAMEDRLAIKKQAEAAMHQAHIEYKAATQLQKKGYSSDVRLATARANLDAAQASVDRAILDVNNVQIKAPFDGILERRMLDVGDFASRGDALLRFVSLSPIKVTAFVTEQQKVIITKGNKAQITLVDGHEIEGEIVYVASIADPTSRTFEIELWADNADNKISAGLTANIEVLGNSYRAYKVSPSVLTLSDSGIVGVKLVGDDDLVTFHPVKILTDTKDGIWIKGLDDDIRLITVGQEFVIDGQLVDPVLSDDIKGQ